MSFTYKIKCFGFEEVSDQLWLLECNFNALICVDKKDGEIKKIIKIPDNNIKERDLYSFFIKIKQDLIFIPNCSNKIVSYNLENKCFSSIPIDNYVKTSSISNYKAAYQYEDEIIMLPNRADKIIIYNHSKRKISTIEIKDKDLDLLYPNRKIEFRPQFEILDKCLFIPFSDAGAVLKLHLITKQIEIKLIKGLSGCDTINYYDGIFYLASWNEKKIYALDKDFQIVNEYTSFPQGIKVEKMIFAYSLLVGEKIVYFPQSSNMIVSFGLKDKTIKEEMRLTSINKNYLKTYLAKIHENKMILLMANDRYFSVFFYLDNVLYKQPYCLWNEKYNNQRIENYLLNNDYFDNIYECVEITLNMWISIIEDIMNNIFGSKEVTKIKTIGENIYQYILKE